jgi:hypothetical protein
LTVSNDEEKMIQSSMPPDWIDFRNQVLALSQVLEKMNLTEYITYLNNPGKLLLVNFGVGLLRGLGAALGATLLAGILVMLLKRLVLLNLPVIGGVIGEIVKMVNAHNGY